MPRGGAGATPLRSLVAALLLALAAGAAAAATVSPVVKPTRVTGSISMLKAVRDDDGRVIGSQRVVPEKADFFIGGKNFTLKTGKYEVDLLPGSYAYLIEATATVKPRRARQINERYWAMGAVRIEAGGPATMTVDLELVLVEDSQAFCRNCHPNFRTELGQVQSCHHSTGKPLKDVYRKPFARSGLALEGELMVCVTCHAPHQPTGNKRFLRRTMDRNELCLQCHV